MMDPEIWNIYCQISSEPTSRCCGHGVRGTSREHHHDISRPRKYERRKRLFPNVRLQPRLWPSLLSFPYWILWIMLLTVSGVLRPVSCQIVPRSTRHSPLIVINSTSDIGDPPDDAGITPGTLAFLKDLFDRDDRQKRQELPVDNDTLSTSSWSTSSTAAANLPKNAVLLDSLLLKTRPRPAFSPSTSTDPTTAATPTTTMVTTSSIVNTTHNSAEDRQAKRQQTGRPNFFYLGSGVNGDISWSDFDTEAEQEARRSLTTTTSTMNPIPTRLPFPFMSITNVTSTIPPTRRTYPPSSPESPVIVPRTSNNGNGPSIMSSRFTVRDPSDIPPPFARLPASNGLNSDRTSVNGRENLAASFYGSAASDNEAKLRPSGNAEDASEDAKARRRQGSVFAAPSPVQPVPGQDDNAVRIRGRPNYGSSNSLGGQGGRPGSRPAAGGDPRTKIPFDLDASPSVPTDAHDDGIKLETCSLGDDSTCNQAAYEVCRNEDGATTCSCKLGTGRQHLRDVCQGVFSFYVYLRCNRLYDRQLSFGPAFANRKSYPYTVLEREIQLGVDSIMRATSFAPQYVGSHVNSFSAFAEDLLANVTVTFFPPSNLLSDTNSLALTTRLQEAILDKLRESERRLGISNVYVSSLLTAVAGVQDINECAFRDLNDCAANNSICTNTPGTFLCTCRAGYGDRYASDPLRSGRVCETCEDAFCNQHGICLLSDAGKKTCQCNGWYIGTHCETDGQVVAVACGSSAIALILIAVTLVFLLRWR
ncbi:hypothetical protein RvY_01724-2 [Ramazzottius varieornatus]|uniref:EGF-like domain-containing protein n=1 Tax=Ramazzottius varieornatus TaxID=947166 RepID=A0A1D1UHE9_RAMVA|nr:hypothetical protein RvY_01724-2 [Ramazzottius varieornatus]